MGAGRKEAAPGMQGQSRVAASSSRRSLRSSCTAPAWQDAGIQSLPGSIELRTTRLRRGALESARENCSGRRVAESAQGRPELQRAAALDPGQVAATPFLFDLSAFHSIRALLSLPLFLPAQQAEGGIFHAGCSFSTRR